MHSFAKKMKALVKDAKRLIREEFDRDNIDDCHLPVCQVLASFYDLWEPNDDDGGESFPLWLSRVVEGVRIDTLNGE